MSPAAKHSLPAYAGIGGSTDEVACRITSDVEHLRDEFLGYLASLVAKDLTVEQMRTLMLPTAQGNLVFRVDEALKKVAGWYAPKR